MTIRNTILATLLATTALWAQAQTVQVKGPADPITVGDSFKVDIIGTGFTDKIFGGGYNVSFDASLLRLDDVTVPAFWELGGPPATIDNALGTASEVNFNTLLPRNGDFLTATLSFTAIGVGAASLDLSDSPFWPYGNEAFEAIPVSYQGATINVAAVPEPESWLMGLGGLGILALRLRRRQA